MSCPERPPPPSTPMTRLPHNVLQVVEREAGAGGRATDEDQGAQHADRLRQLLDDRDHTRAVEREVDGRTGDLADLVNEIGRARVDRVRRAELLRQLQDGCRGRRRR